MAWDDYPLESVQIADLTPMQEGLQRATVDEKRAAMQAGEPVKAPKLFSYEGTLYVADGHHTVQAAYEEGYTQIKARIMPLTVEKARKLLPTAKVHSDTYRPKMMKVEAKLTKRITPVLKKLRDPVIAQVKEYLKSGGLRKAVGDEDDPDREAAEQAAIAADLASDEKILQLINELRLSGLIDISVDFTDITSEIAADAGEIVLGGLLNDATTKYDQLVNIVNDRAVKSAAERAGELIKWAPGGQTEGLLDEATRNMIRNTISEGLSDNVGIDGIAERLQDSYAFSEDRAQLIAETEVGNANSEGALAAMEEVQASGAGNVLKSWLCEEDACDICLDNQDAGPIPYDEQFPSGDDGPLAHPNCRCDMTSEIEEPAVE